MTIKNRYQKKRFTLHEIALEFIRARVGGVDTHHRPISIENCIPDILTENTMHEVVAVDIRAKNEKLINNLSLFRHVLWLVLPDNTSKAFKEVNVVEVSQKGFKDLKVKDVKLEPIILPMAQLILDYGKVRDVSDILKVVEGKLRSNGFTKEAETFQFVRENLWNKHIK